MASGKIRAIIFDLGGVLINVNKEIMCRNFAKHSSLVFGEIAKRLSGEVLTGREMDFAKGLIKPLPFFEEMSVKLHLTGLDFGGFDRIYSGRLTEKKDAMELLQRLSKGHLIGLLSNTNELNFRMCEKLLAPVMKLVRAVTLSFEVGALKPDPKIYLEAAKRLGVWPEECVYIDDVAEYVGAAKGLGMEGIQFTSAAQLETDLRKLGVSF